MIPPGLPCNQFASISKVLTRVLTYVATLQLKGSVEKISPIDFLTSLEPVFDLKLSVILGILKPI